MIFSIFCWARARSGKRNIEVSPVAAKAPLVTLTNFLRLNSSCESFDMAFFLIDQRYTSIVILLSADRERRRCYNCGLTSGQEDLWYTFARRMTILVYL